MSKPRASLSFLHLLPIRGKETRKARSLGREKMEMGRRERRGRASDLGRGSHGRGRRRNVPSKAQSRAEQSRESEEGEGGMVVGGDDGRWLISTGANVIVAIACCSSSSCLLFLISLESDAYLDLPPHPIPSSYVPSSITTPNFPLSLFFLNKIK